MKYSSITDRIQEKSAAGDGQAIDPWAIHSRALSMAAAGKPVTVLSIGQETEHLTPEPVIDAAIDSLRAGRHHYANIRGEIPLREAIASYHTRLTDQVVGAENVTVFAGAQNALFSVAQVLLEPGDEAILVAPYYTTYQATFSAPGPTLRIVQVDANDQYRLNEQAVIEAINEKTQAIVLNAPNNPLGSRYSMKQLEAIMSACVQRDIWLILDAVYLDIVDTDSIELPHALPGANERLITIGSLSKSHRMTGWRIGWAVGPEPLSQHLYNLSLCMHYGLPPFIQDAATAALTRATTTPDIVRQTMHSRRALALSQLDDLHPVRLIDPEQGMFLLLDVKSLGCTAFEFASQLLDEQNVSVLPCDGFGPGGHYLVRMGLCIDGEPLATACRSINEFVRSYQSAPKST